MLGNGPRKQKNRPDLGAVGVQTLWVLATQPTTRVPPLAVSIIVIVVIDGLQD
jgi:hypothetical protein